MERGLECVYHGESAHSAYYRGLFHLEGLERRKMDNILFKHQQEHHPEVNMTMMDFCMSTVRNSSRPVVRLSREGVAIAQSVRDSGKSFSTIVLNSKSEFYQAGLVRTLPSPMFG